MFPKEREFFWNLEIRIFMFHIEHGIFIDLALRFSCSSVNMNFLSYFIQIKASAIVNLRRIESIYRVDSSMETRLKDNPDRFYVSTGYQAVFKQM